MIKMIDYKALAAEIETTIPPHQVVVIDEIHPVDPTPTLHLYIGKEYKTYSFATMRELWEFALNAVVLGD